MRKVLENKRERRRREGGRKKKEGRRKGKDILSTENRKDMKMHRDFVKRQES